MDFNIDNKNTHNSFKDINLENQEQNLKNNNKTQTGINMIDTNINKNSEKNIIVNYSDSNSLCEIILNTNNYYFITTIETINTSNTLYDLNMYKLEYYTFSDENMTK
jgi:hypothetical protein